MQEAASLVVVRLALRADDVGFRAPPAKVRMKPLRKSGGWSLLIKTIPPGRPDDIIDWLAAVAPVKTTVAANGILRAELDPMPSRWIELFDVPWLELVDLEPGGSLEVRLRGPRSAVEVGANGIRTRVSAAYVRRVTVSTSPRLLTQAQEAALKAAVAAGYYRIPRPLNLQQLAQQLDVGTAALSERLRRAEGHVITRYVDELAAGRDPDDGSGLAFAELSI